MLFQTNVLLFIERMLSLSGDKKVLRGLPNRRAGKRAYPWFLSCLISTNTLSKRCLSGGVNRRIEVSGRDWEFIPP